MTLRADFEIGEALTRLAVARGGLLDDTTSDVYLSRLDRFDPGLVRRACEQWADVPRKDFDTLLPSVGVLIETVEAIGREDAAREAALKLLPAPASDEDGPKYFCLDCHDEASGWRFYWCQGSGQARVIASRPPYLSDAVLSNCGRHKSHAPHTFVNRCGCVDVNPVIAEHRRRQCEFAERKAAR